MTLSSKRIELTKNIYFSNCSGVFQGGGCKAIAYIGAYEVAYKHGVIFSELAGTSAGSIIAASIALGASPQKLLDFVINLDFKGLLKTTPTQYQYKSLKEIFNIKTKGLKFKERFFWKYIEPKIEKGIYEKLQNSYNICYQNFEHNKFLKEFGIFDSAVLTKVLNNWFKELSGKENISFIDVPIDLHVFAGDIEKHALKIFNRHNTPDYSIAEAVTASCSIPLFFTPPLRKYVDGGLLSNRPDMFLQNKTNYFRTLSFSLKSNDSQISTFKDYIVNIIDTVIRGADEIQHQGMDVDNIEINCGDISATDFHRIDYPTIHTLVENGRKAMETFFLRIEDSSEHKVLATPHIHLHSLAQVYSQVAHWGYDQIDEISIVSESLDWVWKLFPTIVEWCRNNTRLHVYYTSISTDKERRKIISNLTRKGKSKAEADDRYNNLLTKQEAIRRFLKSIGALIDPVPKDMPEGFFFKIGSTHKAILFDDNVTDFYGKIYQDSLDSFALSKIMPKKSVNGLAPLKINRYKETEIEQSLRKIPMYSTAFFEWLDINVSQLRFLNKFIRGEKYKQIYAMFNIYPEDLTPFSAISVSLKDGKESLVGPIVVEKHNDKLYIIEGNTRVLFAYKHNIDKLRVLVVSNVTANLPLDMSKNPDGFSIDQVCISEKGLEGEFRYSGFDYSLFRPIEQSLRPDSYYLL